MRIFKKKGKQQQQQQTNKQTNKQKHTIYNITLVR